MWPDAHLLTCHPPEDPVSAASAVLFGHQPGEVLLHVSEIEFLGYHVSARCALPLSSNVAAIQQFPEPATVSDMQVFLGMVNFYRCFVPKDTCTLLPLTDCLCAGQPSNSALSWTPLKSCAFQEAKSALASAMWLQHPDPAARGRLHLVRRRLSPTQSPGSQSWSPLGIFSKKLSPSQVKWSAFDHELWACFSGIRHFGFILEGRSFNIFTEYRCLDGKAVQAALLHG